MAANDHQIPYENEARLNALMILQRRIFQLQASALQQEILSGSKISNSSVDAVAPLPNILTRRHLPDDLQVQSRLLDDVEITLLGILDSNGMLSLQSRVAEFIVLMTRVSKAEHRAVCLHILTNCISLRCAQYFVKEGGLKLLKRWIKTAEEEDCVTELCVIVKLCKNLPFDTQIVKETEIGKAIKKLLKYRSETISVDPLHSEVRALMTLWTEYVKTGESISKAIAAEQLASRGNGSLSSIVKAVSQLHVREHGMPAPALVLPSPSQAEETASSKSPSTLSKGGYSPQSVVEKASAVSSAKTENRQKLQQVDGKSNRATTIAAASETKGEVLDISKPVRTVPVADVAAAEHKEIDLTEEREQDAYEQENNMLVDDDSTYNDEMSLEPTAVVEEEEGDVVAPVSAKSSQSSSPAVAQASASSSTPAVATSVPPTAPSAAATAFPSVGAFKLGGGAGSGGGLGGLEVRMAPLKRPEVVGITVMSMAEKAKQMLKQQQQEHRAAAASAAATSETSSLSSGVSSSATASATLLNIPSCLKRKSVDISTGGDGPSSANGSGGSGAQQEGGGGAGNNGGGSNKRPKLSVQWADESGKTLREVMIFEVEKIKNSVKDYKSHRDLVRKERQLEKELHQSHIKEAMHPAVEWRKPDLLILPIDVRDAVESPVASQEIELQNKRLAYLLEARYVDDTLIPSDPDDPPTSLLVGSGLSPEELFAAHPIANITTFPWEMPGESTSAATVQDGGFRVGSGSLQMDQNIMMGIGPNTGQSGDLVSLLPPSLRNLDRDTLEMLISEEGNVAFVLNEDGSLDPGRLELVRQRYMGGRGGGTPSFGRMDRHHMGGPYSGGHPPGGMHGDFRGPGPGPGPRRSRFEDIDRDRGMMGPPGLGPRGGGGRGGMMVDDFRGGIPPSQFPPDDRMGPPVHWDEPRGGGGGRGGGGLGGHMMGGARPHLMERGGGSHGPPPLGGVGGFDRDLPPVGGPPRFDGPGGPGDGTKRFTSTKAHTPCRFFNTRKGCQFGDKCPFGHFREAGGAPMDDGPPPAAFIDGPPTGNTRAGAGGPHMGMGGGPGPGPGRGARR